MVVLWIKCLVDEKSTACTICQSLRQMSSTRRSHSSQHEPLLSTGTLWLQWAQGHQNQLRIEKIFLFFGFGCSISVSSTAPDSGIALVMINFSFALWTIRLTYSLLEPQRKVPGHYIAIDWNPNNKIKCHLLCNQTFWPRDHVRKM